MLTQIQKELIYEMKKIPNVGMITTKKWMAILETDENRKKFTVFLKKNPNLRIAEADKTAYQIAGKDYYNRNPR